MALILRFIALMCPVEMEEASNISETESRNHDIEKNRNARGHGHTVC